MSRFLWFSRPVNTRKKLTPEELNERLRQVEAVLFLSREPLSSRRISDLADLEDGTQARTLIKRLNARYDRIGRAFRIEQVAGGFQMLTRPNFANWLRKLDHLPPELKLSQPAFETLSVIAYRQPVMRSEVEAIRGVNCGEILKQLLERDLVRISGRGEELGRPFLYSTTKHFLKCFGLNNLDALPNSERVRQVVTESSSSASFAGEAADGATHSSDSDDSAQDEPQTNRLPSEEESTVQSVQLSRRDDESIEPQEEQMSNALNTLATAATLTHAPVASEEDEEYEEDDEEEYDDDEDDDDSDEEGDYEFDEDDDDEDDDEDDDDEFDDEDDDDDDEEDDDEFDDDEEDEWEEVEDDDDDDEDDEDDDEEWEDELDDDDEEWD